MKTAVTRLAMIAAATGMTFAPIAAQANTRAGDSGTVYSASTLSQPGLSRNVSGSALNNEDDDDDFGMIWLGLLGAAAVIAALLIIDSDDDQSPGT